jgi:hypothetical protein
LRLKFFGDSYDIVKQCILSWLSDYGQWMAHPMLTEKISPEDEKILSRILGVPLLSNAVLNKETNREEYFKTAHLCKKNLFFDPDTGLRIDSNKRKNHPSYLFGQEAISIAQARPELLTLTFDQSLAKGREREQVDDKMIFLNKNGISSFSYISHACFILYSLNHKLIMEAAEVIRIKSNLPKNRFLIKFLSNH